ncbi:hypothetical protein WH47_01949 [Habropoda laboriosa]|uniref:Uncharacterized protein n=1 Tax=Habropoda laboriosa TaxID=597456 RepID=A0A0L7QY35_9HYME|nr:hypothetical protein WH47_01949 [Habropoda laboriosa]
MKYKHLAGGIEPGQNGVVASYERVHEIFACLLYSSLSTSTCPCILNASGYRYTRVSTGRPEPSTGPRRFDEDFRVGDRVERVGNAAGFSRKVEVEPLGGKVHGILGQSRPVDVFSAALRKFGHYCPEILIYTAVEKLVSASLRKLSNTRIGDNLEVLSRRPVPSSILEQRTPTAMVVVMVLRVPGSVRVASDREPADNGRPPLERETEAPSLFRLLSAALFAVIDPRPAEASDGRTVARDQPRARGGPRSSGFPRSSFGSRTGDGASRSRGEKNCKSGRDLIPALNLVGRSRTYNAANGCAKYRFSERLSKTRRLGGGRAVATPRRSKPLRGTGALEPSSTLTARLGQRNPRAGHETLASKRMEKKELLVLLLLLLPTKVPVLWKLRGRGPFVGRGSGFRLVKRRPIESFLENWLLVSTQLPRSQKKVFRRISTETKNAKSRYIGEGCVYTLAKNVKHQRFIRLEPSKGAEQGSTHASPDYSETQSGASGRRRRRRGGGGGRCLDRLDEKKVEEEEEVKGVVRELKDRMSEESVMRSLNTNAAGGARGLWGRLEKRDRARRKVRDEKEQK